MRPERIELKMLINQRIMPRKVKNERVDHLLVYITVLINKLVHNSLPIYLEILKPNRLSYGTNSSHQPFY